MTFKCHIQNPIWNEENRRKHEKIENNIKLKYMIRIKKTYFRCFHICPGKDDCLGSCAESEMSVCAQTGQRQHRLEFDIYKLRLKPKHTNMSQTFKAAAFRHPCK